MNQSGETLMRCKLVILSAALAAISLNAQAADPISLKFASPAPPMSQVNTWGITPWIEEVQKAAGEGFEVKLFPGPALGTFDNIYDRTINGIAELSFGVFGPYAGSFPGVDVASLPFETDSDVEASVALWRVFQQGLIADEFTKVHPMALFTFPASGFHTKKEIKTADDLKGLKVAAFSRSAAREGELLGATPITMNPAEGYQAMQRGLVQSIMVGWSAVLPFKMQEVTNFHLEASLGQAPAFIFMNKDAYAKLPAPAKAAVDKLSYESFSRRMGDVTDRQDDLGRTTVGKIPGHTVYKLSPAETANWKRILAPMTDEFVKSMPNGAAVLAAYRKALADVHAGH